MLIALVSLLSAPEIVATRFELGERMKGMEAAWVRTSDLERRRMAVGEMSRAVTGFFSGRYGDACAAMDRARAGLEGRAMRVSDAVNARFVPGVAGLERPVKLQLSWAYLPQGATPVVIQVGRDRFSLAVGETRTVDVSAALPAGDKSMRSTVLIGEDSRPLRYDVIYRLAERITQLKGSQNPVARDLGGFIERESNGRGETTFPLAELIRSAEDLDRGKRSIKSMREIPFATHKNSVFRVAFPAKLSAEPTVVIGLHGAGGSENLFFEGYGGGAAVREATRRGWIFVAPRSSARACTEALDWLREVADVRPSRVFVMGHSMGGGVALGTGSLTPKPAALALFAPAARSVPANLNGVPMFLAVGAQEMAMLAGGIQSIRKSREGTQGFVFRTYDPCEHLLVVAEGLKDAYRFFDDTRPRS